MANLTALGVQTSGDADLTGRGAKLLKHRQHRGDGEYKVGHHAGLGGWDGCLESKGMTHKSAPR